MLPLMKWTGLSQCVFLAVAATVGVYCGGPAQTQSPQIDEPPGCGGADCQAVAVPSATTEWHPDPDGDGVPSAVDHCPNIYDVDQGDADQDGVGDFCDDDFVSVIKNGPIVDLHAEHVTPYGGWFRFRSPRTTEYGQDYVLAWSTKASDLNSGKALRRIAQKHKVVVRVFAHVGDKVLHPQIITSMEPKTKYYVAMAPLDDNDRPRNPISNIAEITTAPPPRLAVPKSGPRVWATSAQLAALKERHRRGDRAWKKWHRVMGGSVLDAARSGSQYDFGECLSAALLYHGTGQDKYKSAALRLIEAMRAFWKDNALENNQLRWADANLAACADLMWAELSNAQRNAVVAAYLDDDEAASVQRKVDTDEFASITRTWIVDGLVGCNAQGVSPSLSDRACALLERGKRAFYGVQLVKARRNRGFFAQSGGNLPDGIGYGLGTSTYWLKTLIALGNVGAPVDEYAPWVWHNLQAMQIQVLTPKRLGLATFGDLDSYDNFRVEANSHPILDYNGGLIAMHMGLLERAGMTEEAKHARWHLDNLYPDQDFGGTWAMLLYAHDGIEPRPDRQGMPTAFYDQSMGMFFDRTSWEEDASYFTFHAGWSGADHAHEDAGSFQLYRKGVWLTNEDLGYDGAAAQAQGHNVPALEVGFDSRSSRVGQFHLEPASPARMLGATTSAEHTYVAADLVGAYTSGRHHSFRYDEVERHILWLKPTKNNSDDRVIVYDRIVNSPKARKGTRAWQLHINESPKIDGSRATFRSGSHVEVQLLLPANTALRYEPPQGTHSKHPGERYTGRLVGDAGSEATALHYVAQLRASDSDAASPVQAVESASTAGLLTGSSLVLFAKSKAKNQSVAVNSSQALEVWWAGLEPNRGYTVESRTEGGKRILTAVPEGTTMTDAAGLLRTSHTP